MIQEPIINGLIKRLNRLDQQRHEQGADADTHFHSTVQGQQCAALFKPVDEPPGQIAAQGQSGHKHGKHRGHGKRGTANNFVDQPHPDDFIDQTGGAGEKKTAGHKNG